METDSPIAILTDFGLEDHYVGVLKGVINNIAPAAQIIDVTHQIPPGDIQRAAVTLWQTKPYFPAGTIFLCVVDPGVGSDRSAVIVKSGHHIFIGPDNGIFSLVLESGYQVYELINPKYLLSGPSRTFHGRDIFAPAAAHAACGVLPSKFGPKSSDLFLLPDPLLELHPPETIRGQVLHADRFGNLLTSLGCFQYQDSERIVLNPWIPLRDKRLLEIILNPKKLRIELPDGNSLSLVENFIQVPQGSCNALVGSSQLLEIVANQDNASRMLNLFGGEMIQIKMPKMQGVIAWKNSL